MGAGLANDVAALGLFPSPEAAVGAVIELTPSGRLGQVDDMADAVVFLAVRRGQVHHRRRPARRRWHGHVSRSDARPPRGRPPLSQPRGIPPRSTRHS